MSAPGRMSRLLSAGSRSSRIMGGTMPSPPMLVIGSRDQQPTRPFHGWPVKRPVRNSTKRWPNSQSARSSYRATRAMEVVLDNMLSIGVAEMIEIDFLTADGRSPHAYDVGSTGHTDELVVLWHHGTPNTGAPPEPLFEAARSLGIRWISYDRPGYGGSTPHPGATVAAAAADARQIADQLGMGRFAVFGHSGGGPRALACGALLPDRVLAVVSVSSPAPWRATGLDYFAGMSAGSTHQLGAATQGRAALEEVLASNEFDPESFVPADHAALEGNWSWFNGVVEAATANGLDGMVEDDLGTTAPWGFDLADIVAPTLVMHGTDDRMVPASHGEWLAAHCPGAELRLQRGVGHISVLDSAPGAMAWLRRIVTGLADDARS